MSKRNKKGVQAIRLCVGKPLCEKKAKSGPCQWCYCLMSDDPRWYDEVGEDMDKKH